MVPSDLSDVKFLPLITFKKKKKKEKAELFSTGAHMSLVRQLWQGLKYLTLIYWHW